MANLKKSIWGNRWVLRSIFKTIWFNFHYLPIKQAVKLPILLYKPFFLKLGGEMKIECDQGVKFGMIQLGRHGVSIYPNSGITFENRGTIVFKGNCSIGGNSAISTGDKAIVTFGNRFGATSTFKLVSYHEIQFKDNVLFGWDCLVLDTDFHRLKNLDGGRSKGYGQIVIGSDNWFGCKCCIFKNTKTPNYCTISTGSILNKTYDFPEYSIIGTSNNIEVKVTGIYRDINDDTIIYN